MRLPVLASWWTGAPCACPLCSFCCPPAARVARRARPRPTLLNSLSSPALVFRSSRASSSTPTPSRRTSRGSSTSAPCVACDARCAVPRCVSCCDVRAACRAVLCPVQSAVLCALGCAALCVCGCVYVAVPRCAVPCAECCALRAGLCRAVCMWLCVCGCAALRPCACPACRRHPHVCVWCKLTRVRARVAQTHAQIHYAFIAVAKNEFTGLVVGGCDVPANLSEHAPNAPEPPRTSPVPIPVPPYPYPYPYHPRMTAHECPTCCARPTQNFVMRGEAYASSRSSPAPGRCFPPVSADQLHARPGLCSRLQWRHGAAEHGLRKQGKATHGRDLFMGSAVQRGTCHRSVWQAAPQCCMRAEQCAAICVRTRMRTCQHMRAHVWRV